MQSQENHESTGIRLIEAHHRLALWAGICFVVVVLAALGISRSAEAAPTPTGIGLGVPTLLAEEGDEGDEGEEGGPTAAECAEEAQEEIAEGEPVETACEEEDEAETEDGSEVAPEECFVRTAEATIATSPGDDTVRLSLRYTSWSPAAVAVSYRLRGAKGNLTLGHATKHFGKKGVLKLSAELTDAEMAKARAAREFDVSVNPINTPGYCAKLFAQRLSAPKTLGKKGRLWTDPRSS